MKQQLMTIIKECDFESIGQFPVSKLKVLPEVREMCAQDKCRAYNKSWSCPPHCGSLQYFEEQFTHFQSGLAFQTVGKMDDSFDYATISETAEHHKDRVHKLINKIINYRDRVLLLSAGSCTLCPICSCPDSPCRYPEKMSPSMEATGLMINDVCIAASIPYNHGKDTMAFTSCVLF